MIQISVNSQSCSCVQRVLLLLGLKTTLNGNYFGNAGKVSTINNFYKNLIQLNETKIAGDKINLVEFFSSAFCKMTWIPL